MIPYAGHDPTEAPLHPGAQHGRKAAAATHCKQGHEFTPANTLWVHIRKWVCRRCRTCQQANDRKRYREDSRVREAKRASAREYWHRVRKHKERTDVHQQ
jgi:hypothetical protein